MTSIRVRLAWVLAGLLFLTGSWLMFRGSLLRGASLGDESDGGIVLAILEHWFRVFAGRAADWRSPGWYWPAPDALGLSDSLFLLAVPYAAARALGAGWFAANDIAIATLATAGFWGMVLLVRRLGGAVWAGAGVAFIFSFGAVPVFKLGHAQTYTVQLAPALGLMLLSAWRGRPGWAAAAGLLAGLMFLTAAQTPWFLGLEAGLALVAGVALARGRVVVRRALGVATRFAVGLALGLVPFFSLYRHSFGLRRDFAAAHFYSGWPRDWLNVPQGEWMWSWLALVPAPGRPQAEVALGLTPLLAVVGLALLVLGSRTSRVGLACLVAGLFGPLLAIDYWGVEPWKLVFDLVPGGNAVRTPFRIELAAQFFLCLGLGLALSAVRWRLIAAAVLALLVLEQVGEAPSSRQSAATEAWLGPARRPAFACDAFYLVPGVAGPWHRAQSDAMLLSQELGMPTVNGNSSFYPEGWALNDPDAPGYAGAVLAWVDAHGVRGRVCGADPRRGGWVAGVEPLTR